MAVAAMVILLRGRIADLGAILIVLAVVAVANTIGYRLNAVGRFSAWLEGLQATLDTSAISYIVWATGGAGSPLFILYLAEILAGAVSLSARGTQVAMLLSVAGYGTVVFLGPRPIDVSHATIRVAMLLGSGWLTLRLIRQLRNTLRFRAAATAHEIKNTVHSVRALIGQAHGGIQDAREGRQSLEAASGELDGLARLAEQLYQGAIETARRLVRLERIVEEALLLAGPALRDARITPLHDLGKTNVWLRADEPALRHCFLNLFLNAAQHTPPGGCLRVECLPGLIRPRVLVDSHGPGTNDRGPESDPAPAAGKRAGWGLGLEVTRDLLAAQGARLEVEPRPDGGLRATVILRSRRRAAPAREPRAEPLSPVMAAPRSTAG